MITKFSSLAALAAAFFMFSFPASAQQALVFDGKVVQIEAQAFPVAPTLAWTDISGITPAPKVGWSYNGIVFTAPTPLPPPPPKSATPLTAEELAAQMIKDGTMTQAKIDALKAAR